MAQGGSPEPAMQRTGERDLPRRAAHAVASRPPMARIMIVDDDAGFSLLIQERLERAGHTVALRTGPLGTMRELKAGVFDLVMIDAVMPGLDGAMLAQMIRHTSSLRDTTILLC